MSTNTGLNFKLGFFSFCSKAFHRIIFSTIFRATNYQNVEKKIKLNLLFKVSYLNSNFPPTLGYLNPALNNPVQNYPELNEFPTTLTRTRIKRSL